MDLFEGAAYTKAEREKVDSLRSWINVSRELLNARLAHGYTQATVARIAKTNQARVSEIEAMNANPRFETLDRVAAAVGLMVTLVPRAAAFNAVSTGEYLSPYYKVVGQLEPMTVGAGPITEVANSNFALSA
jgi:transcriptional regulator with XRE-family HTH domain